MRKKYPFVSFGIALCLLFLLGFSIMYFPPSYKISFISFQIPILPLIFILFFLSMFFCFGIIFYSSRRGFLIALGLIGLLTLRYVKLFDAVYSILWVSFLVAIEALVINNKKSPPLP